MEDPMSALPPLVEPAAELTKEEVARYSRHLIIPDVGVNGQKRLKNAKVLVIGAGWSVPPQPTCWLPSACPTSWLMAYCRYPVMSAPYAFAPRTQRARLISTRPRLLR